MERKLDEKYYVNSFDEESGIYNKKRSYTFISYR